MPCATKDLQRAYQRAWMARRRAEVLHGRSCADCGATERLELHHIDPSAKVSNRIWSWSAARRAVEIAKCEVVCADCHMRRHGVHPESREHGTRRMYGIGCRCEPCREFQSRRLREYRQSRRQKETE